MARQYKKNRTRGTRKSTYREKTYLGYKLIKKGKLTLKQYLKKFIKENKEQLELAYARAEERAARSGGQKQLDDFHKDQPTIKDFVYKRFKGTRFSQKYLKEVISGAFSTISDAQQEHLLDLLKSNTAFYEDLKLTVNEEEIDESRLSYTGDSVFRYITLDGKIIKFRYISYSPAVLEFI